MIIVNMDNYKQSKKQSYKFNCLIAGMLTLPTISFYLKCQKCNQHILLFQQETILHLYLSSNMHKSKLRFIKGMKRSLNFIINCYISLINCKKYKMYINISL